jgi:uncharacterized protein with PCYCGC motif
MSSRRSRGVCLIACLAALAACGQNAAPPPASTPPPSAATQAAAVTDASKNEVDTPPAITDADLPPLPVTQFMAARPMEIVRAVYVFAAKHPEVLSKMPCFCGCQNRGHKHNDDCFVAARDARGRPTAWEPHGVG